MIDPEALAAAQRLTAIKNGQHPNINITLDTPQGKVNFPLVGVHIFTDSAIDTLVEQLRIKLVPHIEQAILSALQRVANDNIIEQES